MSENQLVDPNANLKPSTYLPTPDSPSPVTKGTSWTAGSGIIANAELLKKSIESDDMVGAAFSGAGVGLDALGLVLDPIGTAATMLVGWMLEHVKPLKAVLDSLAGSPEVIKGRATTWGNISTHLDSASSEYSGSIDSGTAGWEGAAGDAYRARAKDTASVVGAAGKLSNAMSSLVTVVGELCATARLAIHFVISELVGKLVAWAAELLATGGFATPVVVTQALVEIGRVSAEVLETVKKVVEVIGKVLKYATQIKNALFEVAKIMKEIPEIAESAEA